MEMGEITWLRGGWFLDKKEGWVGHWEFEE